MKTIVVLLMVFVCTVLHAQEGEAKKTLPDFSLKDGHGKTIAIKDMLNKEGVTVIDFWATWCKPCLVMFDNINDSFDDLKSETKVVFIAVSIDDSRTSNRVMPMVNGKGWGFDIVMDSNSDFKRAMNVNNIPHTFVLDKDGFIVWEHNNYVQGDEAKLFQIIREYSQK